LNASSLNPPDAGFAGSRLESPDGELAEGKVPGKESAASINMSKEKDDKGKKVEVFTEHVNAWRRYQEELANGTPNPSLWPL